MQRLFVVFLIWGVSLNASLMDWINPFSERAQSLHESVEGLDEVIEQALKDYGIPGLAIGIVSGKDLIYAKGFGVRNLEEKLPVTAETLFPIGSCTKAFTSFLAGMLVDEGKLYWDQPVIDLIPEFRLVDEYATQKMTMRDLLTHRSGMPRHDYMWYNSEMTREEAVHRLRYLDPSSHLRERFQYTNLMYLVAGYAMERLTGMSWEEMVQERILYPLGMSNTNFSVETLEVMPNIASGYLHRNRALHTIPYRDVSLVGPAGAINSNVMDLSHWIRMQLHNGFFEGEMLMSPSTFEEMQTPQMLITGTPESKEALIYATGMGWNIAAYRGKYLLNHDGGVDGFTSVTTLLPEEDIGVVVLANHNLTALPRFLSRHVLDRLLRVDDGKNWLQEGLESLKRHRELQQEETRIHDLQRKKDTHPSHPLEDYVGEYEHPGYGIVSIELEADQLQATFHGVTSYLKHWHYDVFEIERESEFLLVPREGMKWSFVGGVDGEIHGLHVPFENSTPEIYFEKLRSQTLSTQGYLQRFVGSYEIYGYTVEVILRGDTLFALSPGKPTCQLIPKAENEFSVKENSTYHVRFVMNDEDQVEEVLLVQPYGVFSARPKH